MKRSMQEPTFLVLTALLEGPQHGYGLLARVEDVSPGAGLRVGTLYSVLDRLAGEGHVEVVSHEVIDGRLRRSYRLTGAGEAVLAAEVARLDALTAAARARLAIHRTVTT